MQNDKKKIKKNNLSPTLFVHKAWPKVDLTQKEHFCFVMGNILEI